MSKKQPGNSEYDRASNHDSIHAAASLAATARQIGGPNGHRIDGSWRTINGAAHHLRDGGVRIAQSTLQKRIAANPSIELVDALADNEHMRPFVRLSDAEMAAEDLALLDRLHRTVPENGIFTIGTEHVDPEHGVDKEDIGKTFATVPTIATMCEVSEMAVERRLPGVRSLPARNFHGKPVRVYEIEPITSRLRAELLDARTNREVRIDAEGHYENEAGVWSTIDAFYASLTAEERAKTSEVAIRRRTNKTCRSLDALDRELRPNCKVYHLDDLRKLSILKQERKVGPNGIYTDPETGEEWASLATWMQIYRVSHRARDFGIQQKFGSIDDMSRLKVFSSNKREDEMFLREEIEQALAYIFDAEKLAVNGVSTIIMETSGQIQEVLQLTPGELEKIIPTDRVSRKQIQRKLAAHMEEVLDRESGAPRQVFDLTAAISTFHSQIADILAGIEKTDANDEVHDSHGRWLTISKFLMEKRAANDNVENPRHLIANTDNIQRIRRMNSQNELTYLYLESELTERASALARPL